MMKNGRRQLQSLFARHLAFRLREPINSQLKEEESTDKSAPRRGDMMLHQIMSYQSHTSAAADREDARSSDSDLFPSPSCHVPRSNRVIYPPYLSNFLQTLANLKIA